MNNKNNNGFLRNAFLYIIVIIAVVTGVQYFAGGSQSPSQQLSYTQLVKKIEDGKVKSITYQPDGSILEVKGSYKKAEKVDTDRTKSKCNRREYPSPPELRNNF